MKKKKKYLGSIKYKVNLTLFSQKIYYCFYHLSFKINFTRTDLYVMIWTFIIILDLPLL